jgi:hypothetical protein
VKEKSKEQRSWQALCFLWSPLFCCALPEPLLTLTTLIFICKCEHCDCEVCLRLAFSHANAISRNIYCKIECGLELENICFKRHGQIHFRSIKLYILA